MAELTVIIDDWGLAGLDEYLKSLKGIEHALVKKEPQLEIYVKYNASLITPRIIKKEILLYLDILKMPSLLAFDKHSKNKMANYIVVRDDFCCEYCFKGAMDDLFEIDGIEKVDSNFMDEYFLKKYDERKKVKINIKYDARLISIEELKQIEIDLNI